MRISTLADTAGMSTKAVRYYEQAGLLAEPPRTASGYRDYPAEASSRLSFIRNAQAAGLTLAEIRGVLELSDSGQAPCEHVGTLIDAHLRRVEARLAELTLARESLLVLAAKAASADPSACPEGEICHILAGH